MDATAVMNRYTDAYIELLSQSPETAYLLNPCGDALCELVDVLDLITPSVRVLGESSTLNGEMDDFLLATLAKDHIAADQLAIRTANLERTNCIVGPSSVVLMVESSGAVIHIDGDDGYNNIDFDDVTDWWETADQFSITTPPLSAIRDTLETDVGTETRQAFDALLDATDAVCARGDGVGAPTLVLLAGALNDVLLNDLSCWANEIDLASSSTLSRRKTQLEDGGFITTEKVPRRLGRPRLRLHLTGDLEANSATELATVAHDHLTD